MTGASWRVLVTRAREDFAALASILEARGATAVALPCIEIRDPSDLFALDAVVARLRAGEAFDLVVLASPHAARRFVAALGVPPSSPVAAVGEATAQALRALGVAVAAAPDDGGGAEALLAALGGAMGGSLAGRRLLLPRAEEATPDLADGLRARGAAVETVALYKTVAPEVADAEGMAALRAGRIDAIAFASGSAAKGFVKLLGTEAGPLAARCAIACIGQSTASVVRGLGLQVDAVGSGTLPSLVEAIERAGQAHRGAR